MRRIILIVGVCPILVPVAATAWYFSGYMPGTFHRDEKGFPHGTGWARYHYDAGPLMLEEYRVAGKITKATWYRPDGSVVASEAYEDQSGTGYYLRQDGSIKVKMNYVKGAAHGEAVYFNEDGSVKRVAEFRHGTEGAR